MMSSTLANVFEAYAVTMFARLLLSKTGNASIAYWLNI